MKDDASVLKLEEFVPSLRHEFEQHPLDLTCVIRTAIPREDSKDGQVIVPDSIDRTVLRLTDGEAHLFWKTESLRALWRGNNHPPVLGDCPEAYPTPFLLMEVHVLEISDRLGDRRDAEMKEIYSSLRRRPDGRSLGFVHDYMWQAAAIMLGTTPLSQAEFEAIMARLERSCRTFEQGPTSRNYVDALRQTI